MMSTPLPNVEGLKLHGVLDDTWTKQHPQFVPALVWATQHAIWYRKQLRVSAPAQVRCAACLAVKSDEHTGGGHCSKCKQVRCVLPLLCLLPLADFPGQHRCGFAVVTAQSRLGLHTNTPAKSLRRHRSVDLEVLLLSAAAVVKACHSW